jgi:uncharacterized protein YdaU (DUF1376 family)
MAGDFLPYFRVFPAETVADERFASWTVAERGAWFTLLLHAWTNGSVPSDEATLARTLHLTPKAFRAVWEVIGDRFIPHPEKPGRLTSRRLEMEREDATAKSQAGRKGALSRWKKGSLAGGPEDPDPDATALRPHESRNGGSMPAAQHSAAQHNTPQQRAALVGVGHPAFEVIQHWTSSVWPSLSTVPCPDVTTTQAQSLAVLSGKHGARVLCDAMDAAAADPYWAKTLDLDTFIAKHAKWLGRKAPPRKMTGDLGVDHRRQWWRDLTPSESAAFVAERLALDPSLDASFPFWATGTADEPGMQALIERWERRVRETG